MKTQKIILGIAFLVSIISCSQEQYETVSSYSAQEIHEIVIHSGFQNTKVSLNKNDNFYRSSWETGDTITVICNGEYRYYVAQSSGENSTFTLASEHEKGLVGGKGFEVYAVTGRRTILDGNYVPLGESFVNQHYSQSLPMNCMHACTIINSENVANLTFEYPCAYLHASMKKKEIVASNYSPIFKFVGDHPVVASGSEIWPTNFYCWTVWGSPETRIWGERKELSFDYAYLYLNVARMAYVTTYNLSDDYYYTITSLYYHFSESDLSDYNDDDTVNFFVGIPKSDCTKLIQVFASVDDDIPLYEKFLPENAVIQKNTVYELNMKPRYYSNDYSKDGEVITLQRASNGKGIDVVLFGEGYVDFDMDDGGKYEQDMKEMVKEILSYEPYASYADRFNFYAVKVVAPFINCYNEESPLYGIVDFEKYYDKVPNVDTSLRRAIICRRVPTNWDSNDTSRTLYFEDGSFLIVQEHPIHEPFVLIHEFTHGIGKVADEYWLLENAGKEIPEEDKEEIRLFHQKGWYMNVDLTNDPEKVMWSHFLKDDRYQNEGFRLAYFEKNGLGIFEGGCCYPLGVYSSSYYSLMNNNYSGDDAYWLNASCRESVYKQIMANSEPDGWEYEYEKFVEFDKKYRDYFMEQSMTKSSVNEIAGSQSFQSREAHHRTPALCNQEMRDRNVPIRSIQ